MGKRPSNNMGSTALAHSNIAPTAHGAHGFACQTCNQTHGTSEVAEGSESQIRQFLSQIQGLDQSRVQSATTKCALIDILHDAHTQCLRVWGTARLPKSCSPAFISEVKRLRKEDPALSPHRLVNPLLLHSGCHHACNE